MSPREPLPEETTAGTEASQQQADELLEDSEERTLDPEGTQLDSTQTPDEGRTSQESTPT